MTLFCKACKTEVTCNRTTINSHCISQGHHRNVECRNKKDLRLERVKDDDSFFIVKEGNLISDRDRGRLRTETEVLMALLINNVSLDGVLSQTLQTNFVNILKEQSIINYLHVLSMTR